MLQRWSLGLSIAAASCLLPMQAQAEGGSGLEAGVRIGYGVPFGKVSGPGGDVSDGISGVVPLWFDLGYRLSPALMLGLYAQYGIGSVADSFSTACAGVDCSAADVRFGAQLHYHFAPDSGIDPWLGAGFGYEWMTISASGGGESLSMTSSGFELFGLQAGLDHRIGDSFYLGAFLGLSVAQYSDLSVDCSSPATTVCSSFDLGGSIDDKALHEWLMFGLRGGYTP